VSETPVATDRTRLRIERQLPASVEEVFAAWTDPQAMARWLSPTGQAEVEAEVRVDGRFRVVMIGEDMRLEHTGRYLVVDPPRRLSFTWRSPYTGDEPSVVTVILTPQGKTTHLVLAHEQLPEETVASHAGGWGSILARLAAVLAGAAGAQKETA
jgi:uncharacterized protein YndB with AHSA1/START domain